MADQKFRGKILDQKLFKSLHYKCFLALLFINFELGCGSRLGRLEGRLSRLEVKLLRSEHTHLLCKGKFHSTVDLLFDWFGFSQTCKSLSNSI